MRRPPQPSGEALTRTQIIKKVVTHPTEIVPTLARPRRASGEAVRLSERPAAVWTGVGFTAAFFGVLVAVLGFSTGSPAGSVAGVLLSTGGLSVVTLVELLTPERPSTDERIWSAATRWVHR
jgi:hypothetical protein